jgi:hypothetical protein
MNRIKQHLPGFVDGEPQEANFDTVEDLLAIPWVGFFKQRPSFMRFSKSRELLMAEMRDEHWVVGYIKEPDRVDLPLWQGHRKQTC